MHRNLYMGLTLGVPVIALPDSFGLSPAVAWGEKDEDEG
jgi:hypothetical protein